MRRSIYTFRNACEPKMDPSISSPRRIRGGYQHLDGPPVWVERESSRMMLSTIAKGNHSRWYPDHGGVRLVIRYENMMRKKISNP